MEYKCHVCRKPIEVGTLYSGGRQSIEPSGGACMFRLAGYGSLSGPGNADLERVFVGQDKNEIVIACCRAHAAIALLSLFGLDAACRALLADEVKP